MPARKVNPYRIKVHRSYTVGELAACCRVHKNTVRQWQASGLSTVGPFKPYLFQGAQARAFLLQRNASRKRPSPPGMLYCMSCHEPRRPALDKAEYIPRRATNGNLRARCESCGTMMHRCTRKADLPRILPGCEVQIVEGQSSLIGNPPPPENR